MVKPRHRHRHRQLDDIRIVVGDPDSVFDVETRKRYRGVKYDYEIAERLAAECFFEAISHIESSHEYIELMKNHEYWKNMRLKLMALELSPEEYEKEIEEEEELRMLLKRHRYNIENSL